MTFQGVLFVLSAPSGAGKTTLKDMLLKEFPEIGYSISATTRPRRQGEVEGVHYYFKTLGEFEQMITRGEFVEYNRVHANYYGTPKASIHQMLSKGQHVILDLDVYGKVNFDKEYPSAVGILILPPSEKVLRERLTARRSEEPDALKLRLENAMKELEFGQTRGKYEHRIVNDQLDRAYGELRKIVLEKIR